MTNTTENLEQQRLALQDALDREKKSAERNKLGQFATPASLARDIVAYGVSLLPAKQNIRFLDPAIGTGAFYSALRCCCSNGRIVEATGFEVDPHYGRPASQLWRHADLCYVLADFTHQRSDPRFNFIICNPPYVRHHHLSSIEKVRLANSTAQVSGMKLSGLAGLYCYFLGLSHPWMTDGAIAGWLVPSEFMDVNYGAALKQYLLDRVTLLHIHRFDPTDVQFADALVSSAIVWIRNTPPACDHSVKFTFGGSLAQPRLMRTISRNELRDEPKWTRFPVETPRMRIAAPLLGDLFRIKRGIATGSNGFFILSEQEAQRKNLPEEVLRPILPSPRYISDDVIEADSAGNPILDRRLFLLDTRLSELEIERRFPALWSYLKEGKAQRLHEGYICRHRTLWYAQDARPPAPIVCTYLGRGGTRNGRAFRFIRNRSQATVANVYLAMYPTRKLQRILDRQPALIDRIWKALNELDPVDLIGAGRVYGGGLHKLEPKELANVPVASLDDTLPVEQFKRPAEESLFEFA